MIAACLFGSHDKAMAQTFVMITQEEFWPLAFYEPGFPKQPSQ